MQVGESVEMHCEAQEAEGTQRPSVQWRRRDGLPLQKSRVRALGGNITIDTLRRQDFGIYQCVASNEVSKRATTTTTNHILRKQPNVFFLLAFFTRAVQAIAMRLKIFIDRYEIKSLPLL